MHNLISKQRNFFSLTYLVLDKLVGASLEKDLGDPGVAVPSCDVERRFEALLLRVHADVQCGEELSGGRLAISACYVQSRLSLLYVWSVCRYIR